MTKEAQRLFLAIGTTETVITHLLALPGGGGYVHEVVQDRVTKVSHPTLHMAAELISNLTLTTKRILERLGKILQSPYSHFQPTNISLCLSYDPLGGLSCVKLAVCCLCLLP